MAAFLAAMLIIFVMVAVFVGFGQDHPETAPVIVVCIFVITLVIVVGIIITVREGKKEAEEEARKTLPPPGGEAWKAAIHAGLEAISHFNGYTRGINCDDPSVAEACKLANIDIDHLRATNEIRLLPTGMPSPIVTQPPSEPREAETPTWLNEPAPKPPVTATVAKKPPVWALGHVLLYGPAGTGKTALAKVIASELEEVYDDLVSVISVTPAQLATKDDLDKLIDQIDERDVVFIDEIHALERTLEESLYSVLQDFEYHRTTYGIATTDKVPRCTFIGATTISGQLSKPLRDRFGLECELDSVPAETLVQILQDQRRHKQPASFDDYHGQDRVKRILQLHIHAQGRLVDGLTPDAAKLISERSVGNPRVAKLFYQHAEAVAVGRKHDDITEDDALMAFSLLDVDEIGLHRADRRVIKYLCSRSNAPCGERALAVGSRVSIDDLREVIEPRLITLDMLCLTPRGRQLTEAAFRQYSSNHA